MCHSSAECRDDPNGSPGNFCCQCLSGWFGNGQICLQNGQPIRVSGFISGSVNSVSFSQQSFHSYVVTEDGRSYTALSRIPGSVGSDLRGLLPVGTPVGWLFAQPLRGALNGFGVTGGIFNYTAQVSFIETGHKAKIELQFLGLDSFDYLKVEGFISGSLPPIYPSGSDIESDDFIAEFSRTSPGTIVSFEKDRSYKIVGSDRVVK